MRAPIERATHSAPKRISERARLGVALLVLALVGMACGSDGSDDVGGTVVSAPTDQTTIPAENDAENQADSGPITSPSGGPDTPADKPEGDADERAEKCGFTSAELVSILGEPMQRYRPTATIGGRARGGVFCLLTEGGGSTGTVTLEFGYESRPSLDAASSREKDQTLSAGAADGRFEDVERGDLGYIWTVDKGQADAVAFVRGVKLTVSVGTSERYERRDDAFAIALALLDLVLARGDAR